MASEDDEIDVPERLSIPCLKLQLRFLVYPDQRHLRGKLMQAIVWTKYGPPDVLQLQEVEKPSPKDNEVLIRTYATTVTSGECELRSLKVPGLIRLPLRIHVGLRKPKRITILGQELAGENEAAALPIDYTQEDFNELIEA